MTKKILLGFFLSFVFSIPPTWALHHVNCSNADGSLRRVEEEIWGANKIYFLVQGQKYTEKELSLSLESETTLMESGNKNSSAGWVRVYAAKATWKFLNESAQSPAPKKTKRRDPPRRPQEDFVICRAFENSAKD